MKNINKATIRYIADSDKCQNWIAFVMFSGIFFMNKIDLSGQIFGRLKVLKFSHIGDNRRPYWLCECDCGKQATVMAKLLKAKKTKSCGCLFLEGNNYKNGVTLFPEYTLWQNIKARCYNKNYNEYEYYGGRGIKMCDEWKNDFMNFYNDMGKRPSLIHSIDREDNEKGYFKDNCRWATQKQQANNKRNNHFLEYNNERLTIAQWSEKLNINYDLIKQRINKLNWSTERALGIL